MKAIIDDKIPKATSEVAIGNLYDMNKELIKHETPLTQEEILQKQENEVATYFESHKMYSMLLCNEEKDYTVFRLTTKEKIKEAAADLIECCVNRGTIISIEALEDGCLEIWIKKWDEQYYCYYLFPYDDAVLEH